MVGSSTTPSSRDKVTWPAAWNERSDTGQRSRKLVIAGALSPASLPEEKEPGRKGWFDTRSSATKTAAMMIKAV